MCTLCSKLSISQIYNSKPGTTQAGAVGPNPPALCPPPPPQSGNGWIRSCRKRACGNGGGPCLCPPGLEKVNNVCPCTPGPHGHGEVQVPPTGAILTALAEAGEGLTMSGYAQKHVYFVCESVPKLEFTIEQLALLDPPEDRSTALCLQVADRPDRTFDPRIAGRAAAHRDLLELPPQFDWAHPRRGEVYYRLEVGWDGREYNVCESGSASSSPPIGRRDFHRDHGALVLRGPLKVVVELNWAPDSQWTTFTDKGSGKDDPTQEPTWPAVLELLQISGV